MAEKAVASLRSDGLKATALQLDVTSADNRQAAFDRIETDFGRLDILVNNAGVLLDAEDAAA